MSPILPFFAFFLMTITTSSAAWGTSDCSEFPIQIASVRDVSAPNFPEDAVRRSTIRFADARGVKIFGTDDVADYLIVDSARVIAGVMDRLKPALSGALKAKKQRVYISSSQGGGGTACNPGVCTIQPFTATSECQNTQKWLHEKYYNFLLHEFAHAINCEYAVLDRSLGSRVTAAYENAKTKKIWPANWYGMTNGVEYFADFFNQMWYKPDSTHETSKDNIAKKDPMFYGVFREILREGDDFELTCSNRCDPSTIVHRNRSQPDVTPSRISGQVVIIGGEMQAENGDEANTDTVEIFDAANKAFQTAGTLPSLPNIRRNFGVATHGNVVYAIGGKNVAGEPHDTNERLNLGQLPLAWKTSRAMPTARQALAVAASSTTIFAIGGHNGNNYLSTIESFDPVRGTWRTGLQEMPAPRRELAAGVISDDLYAAGGYNDSVLAVVEKYSIGSDRWSSLSPMDFGRAAPCAAVLAGKLYVMGGWNWDGFLRSAEVYDARRNTWSRIADMNVPRKACGAAAAGGLIFVFGGKNPDFQDSVEAYNATTDTWQTLTAKMDMARAYLGVAAAFS